MKEQTNKKIHEEIILAGFGGQGVIMAGKLLCVAAMQNGKQVSHIPSYGAEMRGGTANCSVVISDSPIASPLIPQPDTVIALNEPSMRKFLPRIKPGGLLIYNSSLIKEKPQRDDIRIIGIEANKIAEEAGSKRVANMAAIGRLLKEKPFLTSLENVLHSLTDVISKRNWKFNPINTKAIESGLNAA